MLKFFKLETGEEERGGREEENNVPEPHWPFIQSLKIFKEACFYERPTMENHGCRRKRRRGWERMVWEMVWFGRLFIGKEWLHGVYLHLMQSKNVYKRVKTHFLLLDPKLKQLTNVFCVVQTTGQRILMQFGFYNPDFTWISDYIIRKHTILVETNETWYFL